MPAEVALRKESVDRNNLHCVEEVSGDVALRKESVDRNLIPPLFGVLCCVALRKESVDRNIFSLPLVSILPKSLSARRAWIEITLCCGSKGEH